MMKTTYINVHIIKKEIQLLAKKSHDHNQIE